MRPHIRFNSTLVRFKLAISQFEANEAKAVFQFHLGSIQAEKTAEGDGLGNREFQFHLGSIQAG